MATARDLLSRFGKLQHVRDALGLVPGVKAPTLQALSSWQQKNRIPSWWHRPLLDAARRADVEMSADDLVSIGQSDEVAA